MASEHQGQAHVIVKSRMNRDRAIYETTCYMVGPRRRTAEAAVEDLSRWLEAGHLQAERDEAREQVIAAEAEATELALRVEELEVSLRRCLSLLDAYAARLEDCGDPDAECPLHDAYKSRDEHQVASAEARALLGEGAADAD